MPFLQAATLGNNSTRMMSNRAPPGLCQKPSARLYRCSHGVLLPGILWSVLVVVWAGPTVSDNLAVSWCSVGLRRGRRHVLPEGSFVLVWDGLGWVIRRVPQFCRSCVRHTDVVPLGWVDNRLSSVVVGKISLFVRYSWPS